MTALPAPSASISSQVSATAASAAELDLALPQFSELWADLARGRSAKLDAFLSAGGDPAARFFTELGNNKTSGLTLLMAAASSGSKKLVERLLPFCDAKAADSQGRTALICAMSASKAHAALALLPRSDLAARRPNGQAPLHQALYRDWSKPDCERLFLALLKAGANANQPGMIGRTPLHQALVLKNFNAVRILGPLSDVSIKDETGESAWAYAKDVATACDWWDVADSVVCHVPRARALKFAHKHGWQRFPEFSRHLAQEEAIALSKAAEQKKSRAKPQGGQTPPEARPRRSPRL